MGPTGPQLGVRCMQDPLPETMASPGPSSTIMVDTHPKVDSAISGWLRTYDSDLLYRSDYINRMGCPCQDVKVVQET